MSGSNGDKVAGYAGGFVSYGARAEMRAFDKLPRTIRRALAEAPFNISAISVQEIRAAGGWRAVVRQIAESADLWFEACEKETGVPRPRKPLRCPR